MEKFIRLPESNNDKASQIRLINDKISVKIHGLESLGIKSEQYGSFLIPVIMSRLPLDVALMAGDANSRQI